MFCLRMWNYGRSLITMNVCLTSILLGCFIQQIESKDGGGSSASGNISTIINNTTLKTQVLTSKNGGGSSKSGNTSTTINTTLKTQVLTSKDGDGSSKRGSINTTLKTQVLTSKDRNRSDERGNVSTRINTTLKTQVLTSKDINECASSSKVCHQNATCINTFGSFTCTCNTGFAGNGTNCVDVNECTSLSNPCHQKATCTNNFGSFTCTCNPGYLGNGTNCVEPSDVRFPRPICGNVDGRIYIQGHVEILHKNQWGTICDDEFDNNDAKVICKMAGYKDGVYKPSYKQKLVQKASKVWLDDVECYGSEPHINLCRHRLWGKHNCGPSEDVGIRCYGPNITISATTCAPTTATAPVPTTATAPVPTTATAPAPTTATAPAPTTATAPAPTTATAPGPSEIRFPKPVRGDVNGRLYIQGHVEILHNNQWGTICDDYFDNNGAKVICKMAGYKDGRYHTSYKQREARKASKIWLDDVKCLGPESHISNCPHRAWGENNCGYGESVGIRCFIGGLSEVRFPGPIHGYDNNRDYIQGHVEIFHDNRWGTICDDEFDNNDAKVICTMAGYKDGVYKSSYKQTLVQKASKIWLDDVKCNGRELHISECRHRPWGLNDCGSNEDVGIRCYVSAFRARLTTTTTTTTTTTATPTTTGGSTVLGSVRFPKTIRGQENGRLYIQGHVEIFHNNRWGTICDDGFDSNDAKVICRMAGLEKGSYNRAFKQPSATKARKIWFTNIDCDGIESNIKSCRYRFWNPNNCNHGEDVGIRCFFPVSGSDGIRFPNRVSGVEDGRRYVQGHVEIFHNNQWGTICDDGFDSNDARVICRIAGYKDGAYSVGYKQPSANKARKIWLSNVVCSGTEPNLHTCRSYHWNPKNCVHWEDVGIRCYLSEVELTVTVATKEKTVASINITGLIGGIIGALVFITIVVCIRPACSSQTSHPVPYHAEDQHVNLQELPPLMSDVSMDRSTSQMVNGIPGSNLSISASAPLYEEEHELPQDSILTEISDGPPRYRSIFSPGHVPITSDEGLPPPPSYEDATTEVVL